MLQRLFLFPNAAFINYASEALLCATQDILGLPSN